MSGVFPFGGGPALPERPVGPAGTELLLHDQYGLPSAGLIFDN